MATSNERRAAPRNDRYGWAIPVVLALSIVAAGALYMHGGGSVDRSVLTPTGPAGAGAPVLSSLKPPADFE